MIGKTFRILAFTVTMTVLMGLVYPLAVTGIAGALFPAKASGSLIEKDGQIIGSSLIAQNFERPEYFHPRPSAAGDGYEADNSGASNLGVTSKALNETYAERIAKQIDLNGNAPPPADLIMASGSGLDPHISPESANYQAERVAKARNISLERVQAAIKEHTEGRTLGLLGAPRVNVLELNLTLDTIEKTAIDQ
jgi:K+-transporting ATPase ATPase C chain